MKYWPVPNSYSKKIPLKDSSGSFWEHRGDRFHTGIDIYAPKDSDVLCIEDGRVIETGIFTSPDKIPYWNTTYYVLVENNSGLICRYAELGDITVKNNESIKAGQLIGHIGTVLNFDKISKDSPIYIRNLKKKSHKSMLHFELYTSYPKDIKDYVGGNI